jgi:DNA-binding transcriptional LysR family regulator
MELSQLETFLAVAEERSFSRAAVRLHRTQPAVSQVIRKLEASVGETLFDRAARDGSLTAAGTLLRDYALRLLALRREASSALDELKSLERGHLQLAANEYTCMYLLPAIDAFRREYPHIDVTVQRMLASRIPEELSRRTFELGVISFRPDPAQIRTIAVYGDSLDFIVSPSHPLAKAERVSIRDLGNETFIAHNVASPLRRRVIEAFQRHRTPLNMSIELPTIEAIKRFVAMGNGVALVPHLTVARELEIGDLVRIPVDELEVRRVLRLASRRQATLSYAAKAFLGTLKDLADKQGPPFFYHVEKTGNKGPRERGNKKAGTTGRRGYGTAERASPANSANPANSAYHFPGNIAHPTEQALIPEGGCLRKCTQTGVNRDGEAGRILAQASRSQVGVGSRATGADCAGCSDFRRIAPCRAHLARRDREPAGAAFSRARGAGQLSCLAGGRAAGRGQGTAHLAARAGGGDKRSGNECGERANSAAHPDCRIPLPRAPALQAGRTREDLRSGAEGAGHRCAAEDAFCA